MRRPKGIPAWHRPVEVAIFATSLVSLVAIVLIFGFIAREALPALWSTSAEGYELIDLIVPRQWPGYEEPVYVWQPVGKIPKYNVVPLFVGTLKVTFIAMLISAPTGIACAIYLAHYAGRRTREIVKPIIELLASIPSVVLGFFALVLIAGWLHDTFDFEYRLNGVVAAVGLAVTIVPVVFTISEDALAAVPRPMLEAARALGARRHQLALRVALPAAMPGVAAALVLGFGRAIGETMVVLMASGNAAVVEPLDLTTSVRTITATIAAELGEVPRGSEHWRILFLLGLALFVLTFALNIVASVIVRRLDRRLQGVQG